MVIENVGIPRKKHVIALGQQLRGNHKFDFLGAIIFNRGENG
jgi:hypothetical protein